MAEYAWSETDAINRRRLCSIAGGLDPGTLEHLERLGVGEGWNCAEIGAGVGTIAGWLAERVGPSGREIATDLDIRWMTDLESSVEIRVEDITNEPPADGTLDLAHARVVLTHVRDGERAVANMIQSLRPGGWLLVEEPDQSLVMGRSIPDEPAIGRFAQAMRAITERGGGDANFGLRVADLSRKHRLQDIEVHVRLPEVTPDLVSMLEAGREALVSMGLMEPGDIERITEFISDPANVMFGPIIIATSARKPG